MNVLMLRVAFSALLIHDIIPGKDVRNVLRYNIESHVHKYYGADIIN